MVSRTDDIRTRILEGLEEDLEALREDLLTQLDTYEGGLRQLHASLPDWLDLPYAYIRDTIRFGPDSPLTQDALLGPRVVAHAAGEFEAFIHEWYGRQGELVDLDIQDDANLSAQYRRAATKMARVFDTIEDTAEEVELSARQELNALRDEILTQLEEERRVDAEALQDLVSSGDLERGRSARLELAELWEEQRRRSTTFTQHWDRLVEHVHTGLTHTHDGLQELREMLQHARMGLERVDASEVSEATDNEETSAPHADVDPPPPAPTSSRPTMELVLDDEEDEHPADAPTEPPREVEEPPPAHPSDEARRELQVLPDAEEDPEEDRDGDFDPYGDLAEPEQPDPEEEEAARRAAARARFLSGPDTPEAKEFLAERDSFDDDLIFESEADGDGPMIDFFDEEEASPAESSQEFFAAEPPPPREKRSPYDMFLSEDTSEPYVDPTPLLHEPLSTPLIEDPPPEGPSEELPPPTADAAEVFEADEIPEDEATLEMERDPSHSEVTQSDEDSGVYAPDEAAQTPQDQTPEAAACDAAASADAASQAAASTSLEDATSSTQPLSPTDEDAPEAPVIDHPVRQPSDAFGDNLPTIPPAPNDGPAASPEADHEIDDASSADTDIDALTQRVSPHEQEALAEASSAKSEVSDESDASDESDDATRGEALQNVPPADEDDRERAPGAPAPPGDVEHAAEEPEDPAPPVDAPLPTPAQGVCMRVREAPIPLGLGELLLGYGLPLLVVLGLLGLAASAETVQENPLQVGSGTQIAGILALVWLGLGPWILRWRVAWRGWRPIPLRMRQVRDEAGVELMARAMELGPWRIAREGVKEVSRGRWESPADQTRGWLLTLVDTRGRVWHFASSADDEAWMRARHPLGQAPNDCWQTDEDLLDAIEEWALAAPAK